jgi:hypothetical protein
MGYTTDFEGQISLSRALTEEQAHYITQFSDTRRMGRDANICQEFDDPVREMVGLPIGVEGEFCVFDYGYKDRSVIDHNQPPSTQPGLWCNWVATEDLSAIKWNGAEKFYYYLEWLVYIHDNMLVKWGITYTTDGKLTYQGEEDSDNGEIFISGGSIVKTNKEGFNEVCELKPVENNKITGDN